MTKNTELDIGTFNINEEDIDPETGRFLGDNNKIKLENKSDFKLLLIKQNNIEKMDWSDTNYINDILNSDFIETVTFSPLPAVPQTLMGLSRCIIISLLKMFETFTSAQT